MKPAMAVECVCHHLCRTSAFNNASSPAPRAEPSPPLLLALVLALPFLLAWVIFLPPPPGPTLRFLVGSGSVGFDLERAGASQATFSGCADVVTVVARLTSSSAEEAIESVPLSVCEYAQPLVPLSPLSVPGLEELAGVEDAERTRGAGHAPPAPVVLNGISTPHFHYC